MSICFRPSSGKARGVPGHRAPLQIWNKRESVREAGALPWAKPATASLCFCCVRMYSFAEYVSSEEKDMVFFHSEKQWNRFRITERKHCKRAENAGSWDCPAHRLYHSADFISTSGLHTHTMRVLSPLYSNLREILLYN